jgi:hypothetical protein
LLSLALTSEPRTLAPAVWPQAQTEGCWMAGFLFRLELESGAAADPSTFSAARPDWPVGSLIHIRSRTLRVVGGRDDDGDQAPVLVVKDA